MERKRYFDTELKSKAEETHDYRMQLEGRERESQEMHHNIAKLKSTGHSMVRDNPMVGGY